MLKGLGISLIFATSISVGIFYWYINNYSPSPSLFLITDFLEAKSVSTFGSFLNHENLSTVTNSVGIPRLSLPILFLSFLSFLSFKTNFLLALNFIFLASSAFLIWRKTKTSYIFIPIILLSPFFLQSITLQVGTSLLVLLFSLYAYSDNEKIKFFASLMAILTSYASWPIFIILNGYSFLKNKSRTNLFIFVSSLVLILVLYRGTDLVPTYFPILLPKTHGYFIDIHRQADLVSGVPLLGKIFYNKYIAILRAVFEEGIKFLDWDYLVFHTATGKFISSPPTFAMLSIFELPLLIYSGFLVYKRKIAGGIYVFAAIFAISLFKHDDQLLPIYYLSLVFLLIQAWKQIKHKISPKISIIFLLFILISRIILVNHAALEIRSYGSQFDMYEELAENISDQKTEILITDRLGQPHIYLAYLNAISIEELRNEMANTTRRDSHNLIQPDKIGKYTFSSFTFRSESPEFRNVEGKTIIELEKNFEDKAGGKLLNKYLRNEKGEELRLYILDL